jgi:hypothetical protein
MRLTSFALGLLLSAALPAAAQIDTRLVAGGLTEPLFATAPLDDGRLFVVEKGGVIKVVRGGVASSFLSFGVATGGEQGLLGLAFDPDYANAGSAGHRRFFVNYIDPITRDTVIASYRTSAGNASLADPASRVEVLRIDQPDAFSNHKAGWIGFRPGDRNHLFIATGDGGGDNDPLNSGQDTGSLLGKMLRIDVNRDDFASPDVNYGVPADNPYFGEAGYRGEIFALGLRNPYRSSFDRGSGDLWIGDVGQGAREEVNLLLANSIGGDNFGWRLREGFIATPGVGGTADGLTDPLFDYDRSFGRAVTGGYVVRNTALGPLNGRYVFGDFFGRVWAMPLPGEGFTPTMADAEELTGVLNAGGGGALGLIASFGEGPNGELYVVDFGGKVVQVVPEPAAWLMLLVGGALLLARRWRGPAR